MNVNNSRLLPSMVAVVLLTGTVITASPASAGQSRTLSPFNRIVIMLDASGSYKGRQTNAIDKAKGLLDTLATKRKKRWEQEDQVIVVSLDSIPEEIWRGTPSQLASGDSASWIKRLRARADYAACTDVVGGFDLAAKLLEATPVPTEKYLVVFSDLIHEPPLTDRKCKKPDTPSVPSKEFAWDRFADVSVAVFWMPPMQKLAWHNAVKEQGLSTFRLYTTSESAEAQLEPPAAAKRKVSDADKAAATERFTDFVLGIVRFMGYGLATLLLVAFGGLWLARRASRPRADKQRNGSSPQPPAAPPGRPRGTTPRPFNHQGSR